MKPLLEDEVKILKPGDTVLFKERESQAYLVREVIGKPYFDELIGLWFVATNYGYYRQDVLYIPNNLPKEPSKEA